MKIFNFIQTTYLELSKVSWIKTDDFFKTISLVLLTIVIVGLFFAVIDSVSSYLLFKILS